MQIAGAYTRPLMMRNASFFVETEHDVNVVDIQTHSVFVDIRIRTDRDAQLECDPPALSLADYNMEQLAVLAHNHCFAGISVIDYGIAGYQGQPVCNRLHCFDWAPTSAARTNNQWRIQTEFDRGGWVELGVAKDEHGQANYVEHWATIPGTREGPFLVLRRNIDTTVRDQRGAMLVIAGRTFGYIVERAHQLLAEQGKQKSRTVGSGTAEMVATEVAKALASPNEETERRAWIEAMLDMECSVGRIVDPETASAASSWIIELSTFPWLQQTDWMRATGGGPRVLELDVAAGSAAVASASGIEQWEVFENIGVDDVVARRLFGHHAIARGRQPSKL